MSERKSTFDVFTGEHYPVKDTKYPTPFDDVIAKQTQWLKENNHSLWERAQSTPSELCFKVYMLSFGNLYDSNEIQDYVDHKTDEIPSMLKVRMELANHPDTTLEDLEWRLALAKGTPAVVGMKKKIAKFKEEHGITD